MDAASTSFILGYHGCDIKLAKRAFAGEEPFDTVRAAFIEGEPLYKSAGFSAKSHIQVCVRNLRSIKGYFRRLDDRGIPVSFA